MEDGVYRHWRDISRLGKVVGAQQYSDVVIEFCLTIKQVYVLALRQCTDFMKSFALMGFSALAVLDYSTLCRKAAALKIKTTHRSVEEKFHIAVGSTGLKVFGEGDLVMPFLIIFVLQQPPCPGKDTFIFHLHQDFDKRTDLLLFLCQGRLFITTFCFYAC